MTLLLGIEDDDVGVGADGERALARVEAEELRRVRREQLDHPVQRDAALADAELVDHLQPVLEPGAAVRDLREVVLPERLLAVPAERAVVGRDRRQDVVAHRVPEHVLVRLVARRRRVDVLRAFEVRPLEEGVVDEEVLGAASRPRRPSPSRVRARSARPTPCTRRGRRTAAQPATRASWIARFVASPSVSGGRVSACQCGSV